MSQPQQLHLQRKYKIVAGAPNYNDFLVLLQQLADDAADIRTPIEGVQSIETRQAINSYLQNAVDTIRRVRKNDLEQGLGIDD